MFKKYNGGGCLYLTAVLMMVSVVIGCAGGNQQAQVEPQENILRVGVSTNYPPLIFKQGEEIVGVEADLARELAAHLGKELKFVEVPWRRQIDQLVDGQTDIIMAGMSVTKARLYKIDFSKAYFKTGQMVLIGSKSEFKYLDNIAALQAQIIAMEVGVVRDTTGEAFAMEKMNMARGINRFDTSAEAVEALKGQTIDLLVYDGVAVLMLEATNQQHGLKKVPMFLTDEYLAWGVRKNNPEMLDAANGFLEEIKTNGKLKEILSRWIPNISDLE